MKRIRDTGKERGGRHQKKTKGKETQRRARRRAKEYNVAKEIFKRTGQRR